MRWPLVQLEWNVGQRCSDRSDGAPISHRKANGTALQQRRRHLGNEVSSMGAPPAVLVLAHGQTSH